MHEILPFIACGVLAVLALVAIVATAWELDNRKAAREQAERDRIAQEYARQWYRRFEE